MQANAIFGCKSLAERIVDASWLAAIVSTLVFSLAILSMLLVGVAMDFNIVNVPHQYCHYSTGDQQIDDWCNGLLKRS
jgi:hypothetical protein